jgi:hypothetical protein
MIWDLKLCSFLHAVKPLDVRCYETTDYSKLEFKIACCVDKQRFQALCAIDSSPWTACLLHNTHPFFVTPAPPLIMHRSYEDCVNWIQRGGPYVDDRRVWWRRSHLQPYRWVQRCRYVRACIYVFVFLCIISMQYSFQGIHLQIGSFVRNFHIGFDHDNECH